MDIGGIGSFILDLSKTVLEARKEYKKKHDKDSYIDILEDSFEELKIEYQKLENENHKLQNIINEYKEIKYNINHHEIIKQFTNYECEYDKMYNFVKDNLDYQKALYELIDQDIIYHYNDNDDYLILEHQRVKAINILQLFD